VPLQVYAITRSSLDVGLIGLAALVPLVVFGLYGGSIADAVDRRKLVLLTSTATMLVSAVLLVQAVLAINRVTVLFACVAVQSAFAAIDSPTRRAIIPQLVRTEKLPAANTLSYGSTQLAIIAGPLLAGVAVRVLAVSAGRTRSTSGRSPPPSTPRFGCRRCRLVTVPDGPGWRPSSRGCGSSRDVR
jgi:MFS family permease